ncbi:MORN repeat protein [Tenacibaculum gallaicum]|uniref:MORN repeat protein n=1 Tax=Tenacibaculum gallaicum TaxID=561505 RepID=A0A3E0HJ30_9FLAO|nr:hypothetical protein [Tenacibaculum gallaicum]REH46499.1 MORN repeat protein [Tenacibaculum gallaicum]
MKTLFLNFLLLAIPSIVFAQEDDIIEESIIETTIDEVEKEHIEYYPNGQLKEQCLKNEKGDLLGEWKSYYQNGKLQEKGKYFNNKKNGEWKKYHENGQLFEVAMYNEEGNVQGKIIRYHDNSKKAKVGYGEGTGVYKWTKEYDIEGRLINEELTSFKWKTYNEDGTLYRSGEYLDKKKNGKWAWYTDNKIKFFFEKKNGLTTGMQSFYRNGHKNEVFEYDKEGNKIKETKYYNNDNHSLEFIKSYKNNLKHGKWVSYFKEGTFDEVIEYEEGDKHGEEKWYYENGKLKLYKKYQKGRKIEKAMVYDEKGKIIKTEKLEN